MGLEEQVNYGLDDTKIHKLAGEVVQAAQSQIGGESAHDNKWVWSQAAGAVGTRAVELTFSTLAKMGIEVDSQEFAETLEGEQEKSATTVGDDMLVNNLEELTLSSTYMEE